MLGEIVRVAGVNFRVFDENTTPVIKTAGSCISVGARVMARLEPGGPGLTLPA